MDSVGWCEGMRSLRGLAGLANVNDICEYPREEMSEVSFLDHVCFSLFLETVLCAAVRGRWIGISYFEVPVFSKSR